MPVVKELDLVSEDDQITHLLSLTDEELDPEDKLSELLLFCCCMHMYGLCRRVPA